MAAAGHRPGRDNGMETVVFDLGGVLIDWNPRYLYRRLLADDEAVETFLAEVCTGDWNREQDRGRPFRQGVELLCERFPEHAELIEAYWVRWPEMLGGVFEDSVRVLEALDDAGVPVYALTNWSAETWPFAVDRYEFLRRFRGLVVSGEEGVVKPEREIYERLLCRYGLAAERTVFIDDGQANVDAARRLGMTALRFEGGGTLRGALAALGLPVSAHTPPRRWSAPGR